MSALLFVITLTKYIIFNRRPMMSRNRIRIWMMLAHYAFCLGPAPLRRFLANLVPDPQFQNLKSLVDTLDASSRTILKDKQDAFRRGDEAVAEQVGRGKDIMSILRKTFVSPHRPRSDILHKVKANMQASEEDRLPDEEVLAQIS